MPMFRKLKPSEANAFSLLELSVVVVILSLFFAGISQGQKILDNANIQATIREIANYKNYYLDFKDIYLERPGDFSAAYSYFSNNDDSICGAESYCNGNGDGIIDNGSDKNDNESLRAWQHLQLAGYIDKEFSGTWNESNSVPKVKINNGNLSFVNQGSSFIDNYIKLGAYQGFQNQYSDKSIFNAHDSYKVDSKYDNGLSSSGWIQAQGGYIPSESEEATGSFSANCANSGQYLVGVTEDISCTLLFEIE